jgi:predicted nucleotidyltransferase
MRSVTFKAGRQNEQLPPTVQELRERLLSFCLKHPITKLEVFGSVADGTAKGGSDVDLMVTFRAGVKVGTEFLDMISELEDLLGCSVDLLESESVATMENWIKRKSILSCTKTIYAVEV